METDDFVDENREEGLEKIVEVNYRRVILVINK